MPRGLFLSATGSDILDLDMRTRIMRLLVHVVLPSSH